MYDLSKSTFTTNAEKAVFEAATKMVRQMRKFASGESKDLRGLDDTRWMDEVQDVFEEDVRAHEARQEAIAVIRGGIERRVESSRGGGKASDSVADWRPYQ